MADGTISAVIAASATLFTAFVTQFLAERYKRFKDGSAVAAGIAGELSSYEGALPELRIGLRTMSENVEIGRRAQVKFRGFQKPEDRFFIKIVDKVGLLGPDLAQQVIFTYSNLDAFRTALVLIHEKQSDMDDRELLARLKLCVAAMERAFDSGKTLVAQLKVRSAKRFNPLAPG